MGHDILKSQQPARVDVEAESKALERALTLDPHFFLALIQKASLLERQGNVKLAARTYHRALNSLRPGASLPKSWQPFVEHAQRTVRANLNQLDEWLPHRRVRGIKSPRTWLGSGKELP